ncbi:hypothetical protein J8TS2_20490 [Lederbergia ruris]|uniref:Uncharacterized protein n=1 Tax=Lederbergia ruris TaxID=217495 RepID=A0ABQ4KIF0_9BACI|nr:hypothetical protein J8TS2_20490 [Lederbergia ruris]
MEKYFCIYIGKKFYSWYNDYNSIFIEKLVGRKRKDVLGIAWRGFTWKRNQKMCKL